MLNRFLKFFVTVIRCCGSCLPNIIYIYIQDYKSGCNWS